MQNPVITIEMMNGDTIKAELLSGDCAQYGKQFFKPGKEGIL